MRKVKLFALALCLEACNFGLAHQQSSKHNHQLHSEIP